MAMPDRADVLRQAADGATFLPVWRRWPADLDTPLSIWLKVGHGRPHGLLLESVEGETGSAAGASWPPIPSGC